MRLRIATASLIAALTMPLGLAAQDAIAPAKTAQAHHYKPIDLGAFGGPQGNYFSSPVLWTRPACPKTLHLATQGAL